MEKKNIKKFLKLMMTSFLCLSVIATSPINAQQEQPSESKLQEQLNSLPYFRTYYYMEVESLENHQFEAWFHSEEDGWDNVMVAAGVDTNVGTYSKNDYLEDHTVYAGWRSPAKEYTPVPNDLKHLADGIVISYVLNFPEKKFDKFEIHYLGYFARISLHEIVTGGPKTVRDWRTGKYLREAKIQSRGYAVNTKNRQVTDLSHGSGGDRSLDPSFLKSVKSKGRWINYNLPSRLEGSSVLSPYLNKKSNLFDSTISPILLEQVEQEKNDLFKCLVKDVTKWQRSLKYQNDNAAALNGMIRKIDWDDLPKKSRHYINFTLQMFARAKDFSNQKNIEIDFHIPVEKKVFKLSEKVAEFGIEATLVGSWGAGVLNVAVKDSLGNRKEINKNLVKEDYQVMLDPKTGHGFLDGYIEFSSDAAGGRSPKIELQLPGQGQFTSFDFYPGQFRVYDLTALELNPRK